VFDLQLPLFPLESSAVTITTTVWIGVLIAAFFNLRFGWTLSALVIPGYIVPLVMARPMTASIILLESAITYGFAILISESNRNRPYWSSFFGRDRFFLIVVVSVLVRSLCDGWLLPLGGQWLVESFNLDLDYRNDLNSFGLIAVALIANYFWKPGLKAGLPCLLTIVGLTWAIVAWLLVPFTNFNVGSFHSLYEDISVSMLASPKAYMIILLTGWFASWVNLRYAWDFNGILIPALAAILWTNPERIVISFCEAGAVFLVAKLVISTGLFKNIAMQGGRKLAFFFTVCFLLRLIFAHVISQLAPELKATDFFGLGYLLSTLVAIKIHDRRIPFQMAKGIIQVSVVGVVFACLVGFAFERFSLHGSSETQAQVASAGSAVVLEIHKPVADLFREEKVRLFRPHGESEFTGLSTSEIQIFQSALSQLSKASGDLSSPDNQQRLNSAAQRLAGINYEVAVVGKEAILLREKEPFTARGWFLISPNNNGPAIIASNAIKEKGSGESALLLHQTLAAGSLAIANTASHLNEGRPVSDKIPTFEKAFEEVFGFSNSLFVRAQPSLAGKGTETDAIEVHGDIPACLDLPRLRKLLGNLEFRWAGISNASVAHGTASATVWLSEQSLQKMIGSFNFDSVVGNDSDSEDILVRCSLPTWLSSVQEKIHKAGTDLYLLPKEEELLFLDESVLTPLVELAKQSFSKSTLSRIRAIDNDAKCVGYRVKVIKDETSQNYFLALSERDDPAQQRGWGTVLFRFGLEKPWGVEIPRPNFELRSFEFGTSLFQRRVASYLCIAGAHPFTNTNGSSDVTRTDNRGNLLNLARHVAFRELGDRAWLIAQVRSMRAPVTSDIAVATTDDNVSLDSLSSISRQLCDSFIADGHRVDFVDGRKDLAGYELGTMLRAASTKVAEHKEIISLWVSPGLRSKFRQQDPNDNLNAQLRACGLESVFKTRTELVSATARSKNAMVLPTALREQLFRFSQDHDVVKLLSAMQQHDNFRFTRFFDDHSKTTLVAILSDRGRVVALLNPCGLNRRLPIVDRLDLQNLNEFVLSRSLILEVRP
jgi:hypothetical protein